MEWYVSAHPGSEKKTKELSWQDSRAMVAQNFRIHNARVRAKKKKDEERDAHCRTLVGKRGKR